MRVLAFLVMSLVWGLTWLPVKIGAEYVPPLVLAAVRFTLAGLLFGAIVLVRRIPVRTRRPGRLLAASLLITTSSYALLFWGVAQTPTGIAAVVNMSLIPVASIAIGRLYGEEEVTRARLAAIGLGVAGLVLLFWTAVRAGSADGRVALGLGAIAGATVLYAWGAVISRPLIREMSPLAVAFWETLIGGLALLLLVFALGDLDPARLRLLVTEPRAAASLAFLVLGGSLTGFAIYLWLLGEWGPFRAGLYSFVSPAVAVAVGIVAAGERLRPTEIAGALVMVSATALVIRRRA